MNKTQLRKLLRAAWLVRALPGVPVVLIWDGDNTVTIVDAAGNLVGSFPSPESDLVGGSCMLQTAAAMDDWLRDFEYALDARQAARTAAAALVLA